MASIRFITDGPVVLGPTRRRRKYPLPPNPHPPPQLWQFGVATARAHLIPCAPANPGSLTPSSAGWATCSHSARCAGLFPTVSPPYPHAS